MKFRATEDGFITALRFYKQPNNTGTHVGHLWTADGQQLAEVDVHERDRLGLAGGAAARARSRSPRTRPTSRPTTPPAAASRSAPATSAPASTAAPLRAPRRRRRRRQRRLPLRPERLPDRTFSATNYWVDATLRAHASRRTRAPPRSRARSPAAERQAASPPNTQGHGHVRRGDRPADRQHRLDPAHRRRGQRPSPAPSPTTRPRARRRSRRRPPLAYGKTYTATVKSGNAGVTDLAGNRLAADETWTFSTPPQCPCTIFDPDRPSARRRRPPIHDQPLEVGVKFRADRGRLHHRAALLQAVEQHRHARRPPVVGRRPAAGRRSPFTERDRLGLAEVDAAEPGRRSPRTRSTSPPTTRPAATSRSTRATSPPRTTARRC